MGHLVTLLSKRGVIVSDSFTRSDSVTSMGKADSGQTWQAITGTWGINNNSAYLVTSTAANKDLAVIDVGVSDCAIQYVQTIKFVGMRLAFRFTDADNGFIVDTDASNVYFLYRYQATAFTLLGSGGVAADGNIIKVVLNGASIKVFVNNVQIISVTQTFNQAATKHGFGGSQGGTVGRFDNFKVEVL